MKPFVRLFALVALLVSGCPGTPPEPMSDTGLVRDGGADGSLLVDSGRDAAIGTDAADAGLDRDASSAMTIGPAGGTVATSEASVTIPPGALTTDVAIAVASVPLPLPLPAAYVAVSPAWAFTPHGTTFAVPATMRIAHAGGATAVLRLDDPSDTGWDPVSAPTLTATDATFTTSTFSFYVVVRPASAAAGVTALYPSADHWNDYVVNDGADALSASGAVCTSAIASAHVLHSGCLHGGEMRAFVVPGRTSCSGLSAVDTLGAFDWRCIVRGGNATMVSAQLREAARLADLIDFTALAWRDESLVVSDGGTVLTTTPAASWWSNPIVASDSGGTLGVDGTIYVVRTDSTADYVLAGARTALVVQPGHHLGPASATSPGQVQSYVPVFGAWIEGDAAGEAPRWTLRLVQGVVRHVRIVSGSAIGIDLTTSVASRVEHLGCACTGASPGTCLILNGSGNLVRDLTAAACTDGLSVSGSLNVIEGAMISSSTYRGIDVGGVGNILGDVTSVQNHGEGIVLQENNVLMHATLARNIGDGFYDLDLQFDQVVVGVASYENREAGFALGSGAALGRRFYDVASWANTEWGFRFNARPAGGFGYEFHGRFGTGQDGNSPPNMWWGTQSCYQPIGSWGAAGDCLGSRTSTATPGPDGLRSQTTAPRSCTLDTNSPASVDFLGGSGGFFPTRVPPVDEPTNTSDTYGTAAFVDVHDWLDFDAPYRAWGAEGSATPNCFAQGPCDAAAMGAHGCQIYDFALRDTTDHFLLGTDLAEPTGDDTITMDFAIRPSTGLPDDTACLSAFSQVTVVPPAGARTYSLCHVTFLRLAREVLGDLDGNDNLLCESGETCLFTPNIASYQGHGPLVPSLGPFVDGAITGVTLVRHETNGVVSPFRP